MKLARRLGSQYGQRSPWRYGWKKMPFAPMGDVAASASIIAYRLIGFFESPSSLFDFSTAKKVSRIQRWQRAAALVALTLYHMPGTMCE